MWRRILCLILYLVGWSPMMAQIDSLGYAPINEHLFLNTKWKYTYTAHAETNTVIHKADEAYEHFMYYKYDNTYSIFLNGVFSGGFWRLNEAQNQVFSPFRRIEWWDIKEFTEDVLVLEYSFTDRSHYQYHFVRVTGGDDPFPRLANELPDVVVDYYTDKDSRYKYRGRKGDRGKRGGRKNRRNNREEEPPEVEPEFLQIEMVGGGFFGGIDPVYRNNLVIRTDGKVTKEFQTERMGLRVTKRDITREDLEALVTYIEGQNFFSFKTSYECESKDCYQRLQKKPRPMALRIAVTRGFRRKVVSIMIWDGSGKEQYVDYPPEIDQIVKAIERVALYD